MRGFLTMAWRSFPKQDNTYYRLRREKCQEGKYTVKGTNPSSALPRFGRLIAIPRLVIALSRPRVWLKSRGISRAVSQG